MKPQRLDQDSSGCLQATLIENEEPPYVHVPVNIMSVVEGLISQYLFEFMGKCLLCLGRSFDLLSAHPFDSTNDGTHLPVVGLY